MELMATEERPATAFTSRDTSLCRLLLRVPTFPVVLCISGDKLDNVRRIASQLFLNYLLFPHK
jgi:hypothetical protein